MSSKIKRTLYLTPFLFFLIFPNISFAQVYINEFLPDSTTEWIELYNASSSADYLKDYYIDDDLDFSSDSGSSAKKILTNLNTSNPNFPYFETTSFLNNSGDYVVLFDSTGGIIDQYQYNSNPGQNMTIGRYPDGTASFYFLSYSTKADSNPAPPTPSPTPTNAPTASLTPTSTPSPTSTLKPTPTKSATSKPSPSPSPTEKPINLISDIKITEETPVGMVAGASVEKKFPTIALILIIFGIAFLGYGGFLLYNTKHDAQNSSNQIS